jgi:hypothetical protein
MTRAASTRTDQDIQRDVLEELTWEAQVQPNEIGVAVTDGVVSLTDGWTAIRGSGRPNGSALRVRGVRTIADDIEVRLGLDGSRPMARSRSQSARGCGQLQPADRLGAHRRQRLGDAAGRGRVRLPAAERRA